MKSGCVFKVLQLTALTEEPIYKSNKLRVQNRKQLIQTLSQRYTQTVSHWQTVWQYTSGGVMIFLVVCSVRFQQQTTSEWLRLFEGSGVPVGPINSIQDAFSDAQVRHTSYMGWTANFLISSYVLLSLLKLALISHYRYCEYCSYRTVSNFISMYSV